MKQAGKILTLLLLFAATPVFAQENGRTGILVRAFGNAEIGGHFMLTENWALRPAVMFNSWTRDRSEVRTENAPDASMTSSNIGLNLALLRYFGSQKEMAPYGGLGISYTRIHFEDDAGGASGYKQTQWDAGLRALFGAEYKLSSRFSVFGELAFGYSLGKETTTKEGNYTIKNIGVSNSGIGVLFYFR